MFKKTDPTFSQIEGEVIVGSTVTKVQSMNLTDSVILVALKSMDLELLKKTEGARIAVELARRVSDLKKEHGLNDKNKGS